MYCALYANGHCRSCQWLETPYPAQLSCKQSYLETLLEPFNVAEWRQPQASPQQEFRNKAKMVVSGSVERPQFGTINRDGSTADLCECPLYPASFAPVFATLKPFVARAGLTPYNVLRRRGELKYILLTESRYSGEMMLRFVLRSKRKLAQLTSALPWLRQQLPNINVISVNIQPIPMAILEGDEEIFLSDEQVISEKLNQVPLWIRPGSFFQTNPLVAANLYASAREWLADLPIKTMWDLFCGVGGFGLHCASQEMSLVGIEINNEAIICARRSAHELGLDNVKFAALDSAAFATGKAQAPDLVLVNPPRRGIGAELCRWLDNSAPRWILYSSCQAESLVKDLSRLERYKVSRVQLFDMFPHSRHFEVLLLLTLC